MTRSNPGTRTGQRLAHCLSPPTLRCSRGLAAIAALVLVEKVARVGVWVGRARGVILAAAGVWMLAGAAR